MAKSESEHGGEDKSGPLYSGPRPFPPYTSLQGPGSRDGISWAEGEVVGESFVVVPELWVSSGVMGLMPGRTKEVEGVRPLFPYLFIHRLLSRLHCANYVCIM